MIKLELEIEMGSSKTVLVGLMTFHRVLGKELLASV